MCGGGRPGAGRGVGRVRWERRRCAARGHRSRPAWDRGTGHQGVLVPVPPPPPPQRDGWVDRRVGTGEPGRSGEGEETSWERYPRAQRACNAWESGRARTGGVALLVLGLDRAREIGGPRAHAARRFGYFPRKNKQMQKDSFFRRCLGRPNSRNVVRNSPKWRRPKFLVFLFQQLSAGPAKKETRNKKKQARARLMPSAPRPPTPGPLALAARLRAPPSL